MRLVSIQVGRPRVVPPSGDGQPWDREWRTAFWKDPVNRPVMLHRLNLERDGQAEQKIHGGADRPVLCYSADHYPAWRHELGLPEMPYGAFGENFTLTGQDEGSVCLGDVYEVGEALIQVSTPRMPCHKISWRWRRLDLLRRVELSGRHGWYARVLREGLVEAGQTVRLQERPSPGWSIRQASEVIRHRRRMPEAAGQLAEVASLAGDVRPKLWKASAAVLSTR
jgi:MOSC domain-containing protein YiiM